MDGSLSSSRYDDRGHKEGHYQPRHEGRDYHRNGRGGGRHRPDYRRGGSGASYHRDSHDRQRHQPYPRRGGGGSFGGGGRGRTYTGNRFDTSAVTQSVDPQTAMMKQLTAMIAKMGDLIPAAESMQHLEVDISLTDTDSIRPVMKAIAKNIQDLVAVLCNTQNAPLFLKYEIYDTSSFENATTAKVVVAEEEAGPMATLVASCAATLPLSSSSYAGLTLAVDVQAPDASPETNNVSYKGFAQRCITMVCRRLALDLDKACGIVSLLSREDVAVLERQDMSKQQEDHNDGDTYVHAFMRCKLLLRYLAFLTRAGIIAKDYDSDIQMDVNSDLSSLSLTGLLHVMVESALNAQKATMNGKDGSIVSLKNVSTMLSLLVLSTIPYAIQCLSKDFVSDILSKVNAIMTDYKSPFQPGIGIMAILMDKKHMDDFDPDKDEEEDDDDNEADDATSSPVCADSFQDLFRTVKKLSEAFYETATVTSRFALLKDEPWAGLTGDEQKEIDDESQSDMKQSQSLLYNGEMIRISMSENSELFSFLMNLDSQVDAESISVTIQRPSLEGVIFGRLSIFDPPPEEEDDDEGEDLDPSTSAYVNHFSLIDRFFLSDSVRDCLLCHRCSVTDAGVTQGSVKDVATQIWSVSELFTHSIGVESGIVETLLALAAQAPRGIESSCTMTHVYLSRVLIELIKQQPSRVPQSLAIAVSDIFNDFIPSLSPIAKENLSYWFAFHLVNTDYQWPSAHWNAWEQYVVEGMQAGHRNCRGEFVMKVIEFMNSFESNPEVLVNVCLPQDSKISAFMITHQERSQDSTKSSSFHKTIDDLENNLVKRIWVNNDDVDDILHYVTGDETSETVQGSINDDIESNISKESRLFWRTGLLVRSLLDLASRYHLRDISKIQRIIDKETNDGLHYMEGDEISASPKEDVITDTLDLIDRYESVIISALSMDTHMYKELLDLRGETKVSEDVVSLQGESFVLSECEKKCAFSYSIFSSLVEGLLRNKIISPKGVVYWCLCNVTVSGAAYMRHSWWNIVSHAICLGIDNILASSYTSLDTDINMIIDSARDDDERSNSITPSTRQMKKVTDFLLPLINYTSSMVESALKGCQVSSSGFISHFEADLREGFKFLLRSTVAHAKSALKNDEIVMETSELGGSSFEVDNWFAKSGMNQEIMFAF